MKIQVSLAPFHRGRIFLDGLHRLALVWSWPISDPISTPPFYRFDLSLDTRRINWSSLIYQLQTTHDVLQWVSSFGFGLYQSIDEGSSGTYAFLNCVFGLYAGSIAGFSRYLRAFFVCDMGPSSLTICVCRHLWGNDWIYRSSDVGVWAYCSCLQLYPHFSCVWFAVHRLSYNNRPTSVHKLTKASGHFYFFVPLAPLFIGRLSIPSQNVWPTLPALGIMVLTQVPEECATGRYSNGESGAWCAASAMSTVTPSLHLDQCLW